MFSGSFRLGCSGGTKEQTKIDSIFSLMEGLFIECLLCAYVQVLFYALEGAVGKLSLSEADVTPLGTEAMCYSCVVHAAFIA